MIRDESEERYRTLSSSIDEGFCVIEVLFDEKGKPVDYRFLEVNPAFEQQTGLVGAVGRRMRELAPEYESHWFEAYGRVALTGEPVRFVNETKALGARWLDVNAFRVGPPENRQVGILLTDVTERRRAEEARRMVEFRFRRLVEHSPLSTQLFWPDGRTRQVNAAFTRLFGITLDELRDYNILKDPQLVATGIMPLMERAFAGEAVMIEPIPYAPDRGQYVGQTRWAGAHAYPVKDDAGRVEEVVLVHFDVTEQRLAEEALRHSEQRLRSLIQQSAAGIAHTDLTGRIQFANDRFCQIVGYSAEELLRLRVHDLTHPDDLAETTRLVAGGAATGREYGMEKRYVRKDKSTVWVAVSASVIKDGAGRPESIMGVVIDISDRKRVEATVRESEERYRSLFASIDQGFCVVEVSFDATGQPLDYRFLEANPAFELQTGLRGAVGRTARELVPMLEERWFEIYGRVAATGEPARFEEASEPMGRWFDVHAFRVGEAADRRVAILFKDVTAAKRIEAALRESERRFRDMADTAPAMLWVTEPDGYCSFLSRGWYEFTGQTEETGLGFGWTHAAHPDDRDAAGEAFLAANAARRPYAIDFRVRRADGTYRWVIDAGRPRFGAAGEFLGFIGSVIDITDRKRAEEELRAHSVVTETVTSNAAEALYLLDAEGLATYANPAAEEMFGWRREEMLGRKLHDVIHYKHPDGRPFPMVECGLSQCFASGQTLRNHEDVFVRRNGSFVPVLCSMAPIRHDGRITGAVLAVSDISERKRAEAERQALLEGERAARMEAERAGRMKDEFLATLSHELRTPLNAILGWSQILSAGTRDEEDLAEGLRTIERNARAQTQIIEDLLDMSRIVSGKVRLEVQRIDLGDVVRAAVETVQPAADAKGVEVRAVLESHDGPVTGDPNRLQQVFWNLLTNAVKFTPRGGRVQVLLAKVESHVEVSVTDTGEGITPEFLPHVFDRFRQADASTTRRHGGLGLGLSIVRQLVELHGGSVRVRSDGRGAGSTFTVALPLAAVRVDVAALSREPGSAPASVPALGDLCTRIDGVRVLVVDDEPDARGLVKRLLEDCGAIVATAASAQEGVERLKADRPDVLVSDIGMPGEDGYSLIGRVRALPPDVGGRTPAVALTAYARAEDRMKAVVAGFQHHVVKPVAPAELITMVASLASRPQG